MKKLLLPLLATITVACGGRPDAWDARTSVPVEDVGLSGSVAIVDSPLDRVMMLTSPSGQNLSATPLKVGKNVPDMLKSDLALEYVVVGDLKKAIADCEKAADFVSREMLETQLDDTEMDHAYYLEKQLRLIELVGLPNYLQSQMGSGEPS